MILDEWGGRWDSNPRRPGSQPGALPTELRPPLLSVPVPPCGIMARPAGLEPATVGLAYHYCFHSPYPGLWPGPSLHHRRCRTYGLYGSPDCRRRQCVDALPSLARAFEHRGPRPPWLNTAHRDPGFPRDRHQHDLLRVPRYSAVHSGDSVSRQRLLPSLKADALSG